MPENPHEGLDAAIAALWRDAQPRAVERVGVIQAAVAALASGDLDAESAAAAAREAHKLAGALGTFGMPDGTVHARALEHALVAGPSEQDAPALAEEAAALRAVVEAETGA